MERLSTWDKGPCFEDVFARVKLPKTPQNQILLTCNPTGPDIFHKNFIDNETDK